MVEYTKFVFDEIRRIGQAWVDVNGAVPIVDLFEKVGEMSWRRLIDGKSVWKILKEIGVDPADYGETAPPGSPPNSTPRLHIEGTRFYDDQHTLFQWRGYSMFLAYRRFLAGDDLRPDLAVLRSFGINLLRVFGPLPWAETPDYRAEGFNFDRLSDFFAFLASEGFYCEFVPGCYAFDGWGAFLQRCYNIAAQHTNVLIERVNEPNVGVKPNPLVMVDANGVLSAYGLYHSYYASPSVMPPALDYVTIHTTRDNAWHRKARHAQEVQHAIGKPCISDEPAKAIEDNFNYPGGKRIPHEFVWHHAICSLWTPGSTLHTEEGKWGRVPTPGMKQYEILEAVHTDVWSKIGPEWQLGSYKGSHSSGSPVDHIQDVWTYSSMHPNKALSVRCALSAPQAINGWQVVDRWGANGSLVQLTR